MRCAPLGAGALDLPEADRSLTRLAVAVLSAGGGQRGILTIAGSFERRYEFRLDSRAAPAGATLDGRPVAVRYEDRLAQIDTPPLRAGRLKLAW